jgi:uncharacterized protein (TIGR02118 family)
MTRVIFVAKKRPDLTEDEFMTYWQQIHAPLVAKIPGVRRHVIHSVIRAELGAEVEPICDGIAEIWFDHLSTAQDAAESKEGQAAAADVQKFCAPGSGAVVIEEVAAVVD